MTRYVIAGVVAAAMFAGGAYAQPGSFKSHLVRNAQVFGSDGLFLGAIESTTLDGSIVIRLPQASKAGTGDSLIYDGPTPGLAATQLRVLPAGSVAWTGYGLKANMTEKDLPGLPTLENDDD